MTSQLNNGLTKFEMNFPARVVFCNCHIHSCPPLEWWSRREVETVASKACKFLCSPGVTVADSLASRKVSKILLKWGPLSQPPK
jgi:recombinational DNA repair protein RecT